MSLGKPRFLVISFFFFHFMCNVKQINFVFGAVTYKDFNLLETKKGKKKGYFFLYIIQKKQWKRAFSLPKLQSKLLKDLYHYFFLLHFPWDWKIYPRGMSEETNKTVIAIFLFLT